MKLFKFLFSELAWSAYSSGIAYYQLDSLSTSNRMLTSALVFLITFALLSLNGWHIKWLGKNTRIK